VSNDKIKALVATATAVIFIVIVVWVRTATH
jgi:hypothetical protein